MSSNTSHKSYRPMTILTFRLNHQLHGIEPLGYHLTNVCLHALVCLAYFKFCAKWVWGDVGLALAAALLFAVHPIHVEAVAGVVGRAELLACLLVILGLELYIRCLSTCESAPFPCVLRPAYFALSLMFGAVAMLCKEQGITIYAIYVIYDVLIASRRGTEELIKEPSWDALFTKARPLLLRFITIAVTVFCLLAFRLWMLNGQLPNFSAEDNPASFANATSTRVMTYVYLLAFNAQLLLAPITLCYDWQMGSIPLVERVTDIRNASTIVFCLFFGGLVFKALKAKSSECRVVLLGLTLVVLPFLPASNIFFRVGFVVAERILYIPSLGFCLLVVQGYSKLQKILGDRISIALKTTLALLIALLMWKTVARNMVWQSRETLFRSALYDNPHNAKVHYNYANFLKDSHRNDEAIEHYRLALKYAPEHASSNNNLGTLLGDNPEAEKHYLTAIQSNPQHSRAYFNLGNLYRSQEKTNKAEKALREAVRLDPKYVDAWTVLGCVVGAEGRLDESLQIHERAIALDPLHADAHNNLGAHYVRMERNEKAIASYDRALSISPNHSVAMTNKGRLLRTMGRTNEAEKLYRRALDIKRTGTTLNYLGSLLFNTERYAEAAVAFREALNIDAAEDVEVHQNYAHALSKLGNASQAIDVLERLLQARPGESSARVHLAALLSNTKNLEKAVRVLEEGGETDSEVLYMKGNLLKDMNKLDDAIRAYSRAVHINSKHASAWMNLGAVYHLKGDYSTAREKYNEALRLDPRNEIIKANLEKVARKLNN
ncbi:protein O-mannosyl-transferase TMTC1-like isoform X1 [Oscarella lobularis]|uniref:protein O-mannosyl-transferase TMTC1-like isoform X1 n=1 Tax=Oscarella lobularis TaxID=121494 RepID=UPI0033136452